MPRVDVTLVGSPAFPIQASVTPGTISRQARSENPNIQVGVRVTAVTAARTTSVGVPTFGRDTLVPGAYKPDGSTTGVLPGVSRTTLSGDRTYSAAGMTITNTDFTGKVTVTAANITFRNCWFRGNPVSPATHFGLLQNIASGATNTTAIDCTFAPDVPHWNWNGIESYEPITIRRCNIYNVQDGMQIRGTPNGASTGIVIEQNWIHDFAWFTAAGPGPVHPSDTETHNDLIQQFGGSGTVIRFNNLEARFARQVGHWYTTTTVEPFTTVALHSLPDGGPYQHIPDRNITNGTTTTNGVLSTEANGRYNWDDCCILMINDSAGQSNNFVFEDNWCLGGNFAINGGGNNDLNDGQSLGSFKRNKFTRDQGAQGSGGNTTNTINLQGAGWVAAHTDIPLTGANANIYEDNGAFIQVRY